MASVYRVSEQGPLTSTSNTFDLAIQGHGYFQVLLPNGDTAYSRDGTFQMNGSGQLVTHDGFPVQPGITIPPGAIDITINAPGEILVSEEIGAEPSNIGTLRSPLSPTRAAWRRWGTTSTGKPKPRA